MLGGLDDNDHRQPHPHPVDHMFFKLPGSVDASERGQHREMKRNERESERPRDQETKSKGRKEANCMASAYFYFLSTWHGFGKTFVTWQGSFNSVGCIDSIHAVHHVTGGG